MARLKLFIPLIIFAGLAVVFYNMLDGDYNPQELPSALIGNPVPAFELTSIEGESITEKTLLGEVYLLNVWATWCIACKVEHPHLNQLQKQGVKIIGLNYKDETAKAQSWLKNLGNPYDLVIADPLGSLGLDLGVYGAPETYLVDKKGIVRFKYVGVVDDKVWQRELAQRYHGLK